MATTIRLTVLTGPHKGNRYCFRECGGVMIGRGVGCDICMCGADRDLSISRHHCQMTFAPPNVLLDDLGSANGTYVNGHACEATVGGESAPISVSDGDILTIGGTSLQVNVLDCTECFKDEKVKKNCPVEC